MAEIKQWTATVYHAEGFPATITASCSGLTMVLSATINTIPGFCYKVVPKVGGNTVAFNITDCTVAPTTGDTWSWSRSIKLGTDVAIPAYAQWSAANNVVLDLYKCQDFSQPGACCLPEGACSNWGTSLETKTITVAIHGAWSKIAPATTYLCGGVSTGCIVTTGQTYTITTLTILNDGDGGSVRHNYKVSYKLGTGAETNIVSSGINISGHGTTGSVGAVNFTIPSAPGGTILSLGVKVWSAHEDEPGWTLEFPVFIGSDILIGAAIYIAIIGTIFAGAYAYSKLSTNRRTRR